MLVHQNKFAVALFTIVAEFIKCDTDKSIETVCIFLISGRSRRGSECVGVEILSGNF